MNFTQHTLPLELTGTVESIFHFSGYQPEHTMERVVPTGHIFIIMELDGFPRNTFDNEALKPLATFSEAWISGMHKNFLSISDHKDSEMLVIQFKAGGGYPYLHTPLSNLNDQVIPAQKILGDEILQLRSNILEKESVTEKLKLAEAWLIARMNKAFLPEPEILSIVETLKTNPLNQHKEVVQEYSKTQKHLIDQFKKYVGLTPKVLHRIFRFNEVLQKIHMKEKLEWSEIAYQFEYADQSHFIKEFKEFSGFSPQEFIGADFHKEQPNFFPLDKKG